MTTGPAGSGRGPPPVELVDVAPLLTAAAARLGINDLLHGPLFSLHDIMTAVEVGDAKLDQGGSGPAPAAADAAAPPAPKQPPAPSPAAAVRIADGLVGAEAAWHAGGSMGTTILPCTYMLRPDSASNCLFLRAVCASLRATCDAVRDLIVRGGVSEDEDFQLHPQEVPRPSAPEDADALLAEAAAAAAGPDPAAALGLAASDSDGATTPAAVGAVLAAHLRLRAAMLAGVRAAIGLDFEGAAAHFGGAAAALSAITSNPVAGERAWPPPSFDAAAARAALPPIPPRPDVAFTSTAQGLAAYAETLAHLASAAGLPTAAAGRGGGLRATLRALYAFADPAPGALPRSVASLAVGLGVEPVPAAGEAGAEPAPPPPPPAGPAALSEEAVCASLALPPPALLPTPTVATFVSQAALGLQGWGVARLLNPARGRRRARRALEDWVHVHQHAAVAEADPAFMDWAEARSGWAWPWPVGGGGAGPLPPPPPPGAAGAGAAGHASPLSAWVEEAAARCAGFHLTAGFGLGLYAPHEVVGVLWMADYLARREAGAAGALAARWPVKKGGGKGPRRAGTPRAAAAGGGAARGPDPLGPPATKADPVAAAAAAADAAAIETRAALLQASLRAAAGLAAAGATQPAPAAFNGPAERFAARFACLASLTTPAPLAFPDFQAHVLDQLAGAAAGGRAGDLVAGGREGFARARQALLRRAGPGGGGKGGAGPGAAPDPWSGLDPDEAAALARLAGGNAVALAVYERARGGEGVSIEFEAGRDHPHLLALKNMPSESAVRDILRPLMLQDLRIQCRARGLNPGGGRETLADRVAEHMLTTGDCEIKPAGTIPPAPAATVTVTTNQCAPGAHQQSKAVAGSPPTAAAATKNNYARPAGQNVGNFLTERPSSRVLAPPGGGSQITFG